MTEKIPVYIRFGDLPKDGLSKQYRSGIEVGKEKGVSVYEALKANGMYFPKLPSESEDAIADYFEFLTSISYGQPKKVYLVTGYELPCKGSSGEPLLADAVVIRELEYYNSQST